MINKVREVTDLAPESLKKGPTKWTYPDFAEAMAETIELSLMGVVPKLTRAERESG